MYNPFDKEISKLDKEDLQKLIDNEVAEGWYVEYKEDFPHNKKIGHSIASFANVEGGWYIIGVESDKASNVATDIVGFDLSSYTTPKDKLRNIIKGNINPMPFFESKLIKLSNNKGVLVVRIEKGYETPYITNDGRIYIRNGEGSDPVKETNSYIIRKLFERVDLHRGRIEVFSNNTFFMPEWQVKEKKCFLEAYFYALPFDAFKFSDFFSNNFFDKFRRNFSEPFIYEPDKPNKQVKILFNNFYTSYNSYILRHIPINISPIVINLTLELFENGNLKMFIPVPNISPSIHTNYEFCNNDFWETLIRKIKQRTFKVIDGHKFFVLFATLFNQYRKFLKENGFQNFLKARYKLSQTFGTLVYFDDGGYVDSLQRNPPICIKQEIEIPEFNNGNLIPIDIEQDSAEISIMNVIFRSLGSLYNLKSVSNILGPGYKHLFRVP